MRATFGFFGCIIVGAALFVNGDVAWAQSNPLPTPLEVSGKVISDWTLTGDQDSTGGSNPHLTRNWKGDGTTTDSIDYTSSLAALSVLPSPDVDALANFADLFFDKVVTDISTLLVSPRELQNDPISGLNEIYYRTSSKYGSQSGVWAKNAFDIGGAPVPPDNTPPEGIDGLELWGTDDDHNMFSLYQDPFFANDALMRGISVFQYDPVNQVSSPYIYNQDIRTAIGLNPGDPAIDLDGMMVFDELGDGIFNTGDSILLTLQENPMFHGGEIWVWNFGSAATFLQHGGVTWDSANQPGLLFGWAPDPISGGPMNDINGLESIFVVPEPGGLPLLAVGVIGMMGVQRRRMGVDAKKSEICQGKRDA